MKMKFKTPANNLGFYELVEPYDYVEFDTDLKTDDGVRGRDGNEIKKSLCCALMGKSIKIPSKYLKIDANVEKWRGIIRKEYDLSITREIVIRGDKRSPEMVYSIGFNSKSTDDNTLRQDYNNLKAQGKRPSFIGIYSHTESATRDLSIYISCTRSMELGQRAASWFKSSQEDPPEDPLDAILDPSDPRSQSFLTNGYIYVVAVCGVDVQKALDAEYRTAKENLR